MFYDDRVGVAPNMKPLGVTWIVWAAALSLGAFLLATVCLFLFQGFYWLRFDQWYDWTAPDGPSLLSTGTRGTRWRGIEEISVWMSSAPMERWTFGTAFLLLVLVTLLRIFGRR